MEHPIPSINELLEKHHKYETSYSLYLNQGETSRMDYSNDTIKINPLAPNRAKEYIKCLMYAFIEDIRGSGCDIVSLPYVDETVERWSEEFYREHPLICAKLAFSALERKVIDIHQDLDDSD